MIKGIPKEKHGIADYTYVPLVLAAPKLVGFDKDKKATAICRTFAVVALGYTLLTNAKWGAVKLIPYKTHVLLDLSSGVLAAAAPWAFKMAVNKKARNTLLAMSITGLAAGILSIIGMRQESNLTDI